MPTIRYRLLNVFAETPFGGNPLAVIEDAQGLSDLEMQAIARQFNLSETTFLLPSTVADAWLRIFSLNGEMAFAGHPSLGSAQIVRSLGLAGDKLTLEMPAGIIPLQATGERWQLTASAPRYRTLAASPAELAAMLNVAETEIAGPGQWVSCGNEQALIPLHSAEAVNACRPDADALRRFCTNADGKAKVYVFAQHGAHFEARFFGISPAGLFEDPGTGSAAANLGGWWQAAHGGQPLTTQIYQGRQMGRLNVIDLQVEQGQIRIGGRVIELGQGTLYWE